jgi:hypothetical protein
MFAWQNLIFPPAGARICWKKRADIKNAIFKNVELE